MNWPPYPAYKESDIEWVRRIPDHWDVRPLFTMGRESSVRNCGLVESNLLSLSYGRIIRKDIEGTDGLLPDSFETYQVVKRGDIVLRLTDLQNDKRSLRSGQVLERGIITSAYTAFTPKRIDSTYLAYLMRSYDVVKVFYGRGGGLRQSLKYDDLKRMLIVNPPVHEQHAIVDFLDRETAKIDALVDKQQQLVTTLGEDRTATITHAVTKGLEADVEMKDSGVEWIGEVPFTWSMQRLSWLFETISSGTTPSSDSPEFYDGDINWVTTGELREGTLKETAKKVTREALRSHSALRIYLPGSLLIAMYGATIGRLGILDAPACTNQACCAFSDPTGVDSMYAYYCLWAARGHLIVQASGGGQPNINQDKLRSLRIPVPPAEEQGMIIASIDFRLSHIADLIAKATEMINTLREYRSALITAAVTGKIDVREAFPA